MNDSGSESDDSRSSSGSSSSDSDTESDYSVGKPEPEGDSNCIGAEDMEEEARCLCLFCAEKLLMDSLASHLKSSHGLDLTVLRNKFSMDQLSFIKLVNFIRGEMKKVEEEGERGAGRVEELIQSIRSCSKPLWDSEGYLKPVVEDDLLLSFWFDDLDDVVLENGHATEMEESDDISRRLEGLNKDNREVKSKSLDYEHALSEACAKMDMMKEVMNRIMGDDTKMSKQEMLKRYTQSLSRTNQEYFKSYDDNHIHAVMINDRQRTEAYRDAILKNSSDFAGKTVLDVGCGTSILSMFAAQAGAAKVFAVDRSRIIEKAVEIVRENGFESRIECIQGTVESINLPVDKVDVIISEFMGYFLLFEGMLSSYIDARKKFLRPGGAMYPNTAEIFIIGIDDMSKYEKETNMWDDVYGFKMSAMKHKKKCTPLVETVAEEKCITSSCKILSLDLVTCEYSDATFTSEFKLPATRSGFVTGITGYFDTGFTQGSTFQNVLSTAPTLPETHWYQTTFPLETPIAVKTGDTLDGTFECRPNLKNSRSLDIIIRIGETIQTFLLD